MTDNRNRGHQYTSFFFRVAVRVQDIGLTFSVTLLHGCGLAYQLTLTFPVLTVLKLNVVLGLLFLARYEGRSNFFLVVFIALTDYVF